jgi:hypothetical protein
MKIQNPKSEIQKGLNRILVPKPQLIESSDTSRLNTSVLDFGFWISDSLV